MRTACVAHFFVDYFEFGEYKKVTICDTKQIELLIGELEANGVDLNNIYIVYTQSLGEVRQYIAKVKNGEDFYELDDDGEDERRTG